MSRLEQLLRWCGPDFDGCLLLDECHKAKKLETSYHSGSQTKTAKAVYDFQMSCPQARVVYCSATGMSEPRHMGYFIRLGLWGEGTPFNNFKEFLETVNSPLGARELVVSVASFAV